jgi:5-methylcytosine-specific restriction enzyme subunit McrC
MASTPIASTVRRVTFTEYGSLSDVPSTAEKLGIPPSALVRQLEQSSRRIANQLAVSDCIEFKHELFRFIDVAGLLRLSPGAEVEVVPKFLAPDDVNWREDFFTIASISRFGRILPREALRATIGGTAAIADLVGRAMVEMYNRNRPRPLRAYKRRIWASYEIDGEIDPESTLVRDDDGFLQSAVILDRNNEYNFAIHTAMGVLLPEIRDGDLRRQLAEAHLNLSPQTDSRLHRRERRLLPSRHGRWQDLYDLSLAVLDGFGLSLKHLENVLAPGFLIKTSDSWEALIANAVRAGLNERVVSKRSFVIGTRQRPNGDTANISVTPDVTVQRPDSTLFLIDAKYKIRYGRTDDFQIAAADIYESLAFLEAAGADRILLVYPMPGNVQPRELGRLQILDRVIIGDGEVIAVAIDVRGISRPGGFRDFSQAIACALRAYDA